MGWSNNTIKFALLFALLFKPAPTGMSKLLMKAAASSLHLPPTPIAALVVEKFWVRSFFASAGSCKAAPANLPARRRGTPSRVSGETSVVSTASWVPFHRGKPLAMPSMRPSSCRWWWLVLRSLTPMLVETRAPASLQMRAVARSSGLPWLWSIPDWAQAARWSPKVSRMQWHRQAAEKDDEGSWCCAHVKWCG